MILVEFTLDYAILREALNRAPEMRVTWEQSDAVDQSRVRFLVWAEGGDFDAFERGLEADPTVGDPGRVAKLNGSRLYQGELVGEGLRASIYPTLVEEGGVIRELSATYEGWEFRVVFPDQGSVDRFFEFCRDRDLDYDVRRVYEERSGGIDDCPALTGPQREALIAALEVGYLDVPRESSLGDLGDHLNVSDTAASQRFRRGVRALVRTTLDADPGADPGDDSGD